MPWMPSRGGGTTTDVSQFVSFFCIQVYGLGCPFGVGQKVTNYAPADRIEMVANPDYFVAGEPRLENLSIVFFSDESEAALRFSYAIFLVASLGFLGVGVQPPSANWGLMVQEAQVNVTQTPWALYFPAAAIAIVVIGVNLLADGLRQVLQVPSEVASTA